MTKREQWHNMTVQAQLKKQSDAHAAQMQALRAQARDAKGQTVCLSQDVKQHPWAGRVSGMQRLQAWQSCRFLSALLYSMVYRPLSIRIQLIPCLLCYAHATYLQTYVCGVPTWLHPRHHLYPFAALVQTAKMSTSVGVPKVTAVPTCV